MGGVFIFYEKIFNEVMNGNCFSVDEILIYLLDLIYCAIPHNLWSI